jgi:hypothetical protein
MRGAAQLKGDQAGNFTIKTAPGPLILGIRSY